jgi:Flp pilus assembly pilin Flp
MLITVMIRLMMISDVVKISTAVDVLFTPLALSQQPPPLFYFGQVCFD